MTTHDEFNADNQSADDIVALAIFFGIGAFLFFGGIGLLVWAMVAS